MYVLKIPKNRPNIINILDNILDGSTLHISDAKLSRMLGIYIKPWHRKGFIGIYEDPILKETIVKCNIKPITKRRGVGKGIEYVIDDSYLTTKIQI